MGKPRRVLIIRPSALGDVCRTVPVLASLRRAWPDARIDWVVQEAFAPAIAAHPALTEAIPFARRRWRGWWRRPGTALEIRRWLSDLRDRRYDLVLDCQGLFRSGVMAFATGAPRRIGHRDAREAAWIAYTERIPPGREVHTVDRMLDLVRAAGVDVVHDMRLHIAAADHAWWEEERIAVGLGMQPYAVLAPTSRWPSKRWPIEHWRALVAPLRERGLRTCVIGAPGESSQVELLVKEEDVIDLVGRTSIAQTMAVISGSEVAIANDSAPLHMAVGFDRPCVGLFGPTDPDLVGPYRRPDSVIRHPEADRAAYFKDASLGDRLMRLIEPNMVIERIDDQLRTDSNAGSPAAAG